METEERRVETPAEDSVIVEDVGDSAALDDIAAQFEDAEPAVEVPEESTAEQAVVAEESEEDLEQV